MNKIIVDSGCDLTDDMKGKKSIDLEQVPLYIHCGGKQYIDGDIEIDNFLDAINSCKDTPKTAAPSPETYMKKFKEAGDNIFVVTLSSHLSSSFNSAVMAKQMYLDELGEIGGKFIHVFDSLSASAGETLVALKLNEFFKKNLTNGEIVENVNNFISNLKTYFIIEKYDLLVKTGRCNAYVAKLAALLSIKPICGGVDGRIEFVDKARGYKNAISRLIEIMKSSGENFEEKTLSISHCRCLDKALEFKEEVSKRIKFKDVLIAETSALCATYANRGGIIVAF